MSGVGADSQWVIDPMDRSRFESSFYALGPINGKITGDQARVCFLKTGLPKQTLSHLWGLSDMDGDGMMSVAEFCVAMKLIAMCLSGVEIPKSLPNPLRQSVAANTMPIGGGLVGSGMGGMGTSSPTMTPNLTPIQQQDQLRYQQQFNCYDVRRIGFINGAQAKRVFSESNLPQQILAHIWKLSDMDQDGNLSQSEFVIAMHLMAAARKGVTLPQSLPPFLIPARTNATVKTNVSTEDSRLVNYRASQKLLEEKRKVLDDERAKAMEALQRKTAIEDAKRLAAQQKIQQEQLRQQNIQMEKMRRANEQQEAQRLAMEEENRRQNAMRQEMLANREVVYNNARTANLRLSQLTAHLDGLDSRKNQLQAMLGKGSAGLQGAALTSHQLEEARNQKAAEVEKLRLEYANLETMLKNVQSDRNQLSQNVVQLQQQKAGLLQGGKSSQAHQQHNPQNTMRLKQALDANLTEIENRRNQVQSLQAEVEKLNNDIKVMKVLKAQKMANRASSAGANPSSDFTTDFWPEGSQSTQRPISFNDQGFSPLSTTSESITESPMPLSATLDSPAISATAQGRLARRQTRTPASYVAVPLVPKTTGPKFKYPYHLVSLFHPMTQHPLVPLHQWKAVLAALPSQLGNCLTVPLALPSLLVILHQPTGLVDNGPMRPTPPAPVTSLDSIPSRPPPPPSRAGSGPSRPISQPIEDSMPPRPAQPLASTPSRPMAPVNYAPLRAATAVESPPSRPMVIKVAPPKPSEPLSQPEVYVALYDFFGEKDGDLTFMEGDTILVLEKPDDWWKGESTGRTGWFPSGYVQKDADSLPLPPMPPSAAMTANDAEDITPPPNGSSVYVALYAFTGESEGDLTFIEGDFITVLEKADDQWWRGKIGKREGWFPITYIDTSPVAADELTASISHEPANAANPFSASANEFAQTSAVSTNEYVTALHTYEGNNQPDDLTFQEGDRFEVLAKDGDWWEGCLDGKQGWFPASYVELDGAQEESTNPFSEDRFEPPSLANNDNKKVMGKVIDEYVAADESQLSLKKGTLVEITSQETDDWWEVTVSLKGKDKETGWFPSDHIEIMGSKPNDISSNTSQAQLI
eukprot:Ihof_evm6s225 gene=Ihof_evmTU6s225